MRRTYLGEFEEIVLLVAAILDGDAYGANINQAIDRQTGRKVAFGTVHNTLIRLEEKGFLTSQLGGATAERGGRRKRLFVVTALGKKALTDIQQLRTDLWQQLPAHLMQLTGL